MDVKTICDIIIGVASVSTGSVAALVVAIVKVFKKKKAAEKAATEAEKLKLLAEADADMLVATNTIVEETEKLYEGYDKACKANGTTAGPIKKDSALTKLQAYALEKGYDFDKEKWSAAMDAVVAMTKKVNAKVTSLF